jgi:methyl-accepting chemotaxis protein
MRVIDEEFNIIKANQNMLDLSETTRDQAYSMKCHEQLSGAACHNDNCTLVNAQKGKEHIHAELDKTTYAGRTFPCDVWAVPYKDAEGNVIGIIETFNDITDRKQVVAKVHDSATTVASSSEELAASTEEMNAGMEELTSVVQTISQGAQNQSEQSVAASLEIKKIVDMSQNISESANLAADVSKEANETAKSGSEAAEQATQKMAEIFSVVNDSAVKIKELGEKSDEINEIVNVITGIAEQTNLLALNAAIEAARAGEHGRGFAVVAEEVKKLAEGSAKASEKISLLIKEIHKDTEIAVESMDKGTKEVEEGSVTIREALSALEEVAKSVDVSSSRIINISSSAQEQTAATERAMKFIEELAAGAEEAAATTEEMAAGVEEQTASMEEVSASAEKLSKVSFDLQGVAETFSRSKSKKEAASQGAGQAESPPEAVETANVV